MPKIKVTAVIPARAGSTRLPEKPLIQIAGKPLIQWVLEGASQSQKINDIRVATDDERIKSLVQKLGFQAEMTDKNIATGSDRVWAVSKAGDAQDLIVNVQGDEPMITGKLLDQLIEPFLNDQSLNMGTLSTPIKPDELNNMNVVKVIVNRRDEAIYFSRFPIPLSRLNAENSDLKVVRKHVGIYIYRHGFLKAYCNHGVTDLEKAESLEQLRALYMGERIKVIPTEYQGIGVDTIEDVKRMESLLGAKV